jgi:hypothetical protein
MVRAVTRRIYIDCAFHVCNLVPTMDLDCKRASRRDRFELSEARREGSEGMLRNHRLRPVGAPGQVSAAVAGVLCVLLAGCSGTAPTVLLDTPTGVKPIYQPSPAMPGGLVGPPPGLNGQPPPPVRRGDLSGTYAGTAVPLNTGGGLCIQNQRVGGFRVRGNSVRYGGFRGTIAPGGSVQMVYGQDWIFGQFEGATFRGQLDLRGRFGAPGCTYQFSLERVGP